MVTRMAGHEDLLRLSRTPLDPSLPTGLVLAGLGSPDSTDSVEPFLRNLFVDPAVLPIPYPLNRLVGAMIVRKRLAAVKERYLEIGYGGGSPQLDWTTRQCEELEGRLKGRGLDVVAAPAMSYWRPFPADAVSDLIDAGAKQILAVPLYPQFAGATTGSVLGALRSAVDSLAPGAAIYALPEWNLLPGYLAALADRVEPTVRLWAAEGLDPSSCALVCVAHSLPERFLRRGDPYLTQTRATVSALGNILDQRLADAGSWWKSLPGGSRPLLAFQSKVGPVKWIGPELTVEVRRLAAAGCRHLHVLPVSFTCEHIETLHELDIELAADAADAGITSFSRGEALNLDEGWLDSLAALLADVAFASPAALSSGESGEMGNV